jgi:hypothetical protein
MFFFYSLRLISSCILMRDILASILPYTSILILNLVAAVEGNADGKSERKSRLHSEGYDGNDSRSSVVSSSDPNHQPSRRAARKLSSSNSSGPNGLGSMLGKVDKESGNLRKSRGSKSVASAIITSSKHKVSKTGLKNKESRASDKVDEEDMNSSMASLDPGLLKNNNKDGPAGNNASMKSSVAWMEFNPGTETAAVLREHNDDTGGLTTKSMSISNINVQLSGSDDDSDEDNQSTNPMKRTEEASKKNGDDGAGDNDKNIKKMEELLERRSRSVMKTSSSKKENRRSSSRSRSSSKDEHGSSSGRRSRSSSVRRDGRTKRSVSSSRERRSDGKRSSSRKPSESSSSQRKSNRAKEEKGIEKLLDKEVEGAAQGRKKSYLGRRSRSAKEQAKEARKSIDNSLDNFLELMKNEAPIENLKDDGRSVSSAIMDNDRKKKVRDKKKIEKFSSLESRLKAIGGDRRSTLQRTNSERDDLSVSSAPAIPRKVVNLSKTSFSRKLQKMAVNF